jgi:hypothetical protein
MFDNVAVRRARLTSDFDSSLVGRMLLTVRVDSAAFPAPLAGAFARSWG